MLNSTGNRELAYLVKVDNIKPIEGRDRVECAEVGGWTVMVQKNQFYPGDIGIYFEVDSKVPEKEPFLFLDKKKFKIKIQKFKTPSGQFWSQGLLMHPSDFGWTIEEDIVIDNKGTAHATDGESRFLTKLLDVTYADAEDNKRKAEPNPDKAINAALARHPKFAKKYGKTVKKNKFLRWFFILLWGKKKIDNAKAWPSHIAAKTDVERIQNMIYILKNKEPFVATEKIDGSSCSIMCERKAFGKIKKYICSRNVVFDAPDQRCFYDTNIYYEAYLKYNLKEKIVQILKDYDLPNVALQMEVYGEGIQKRDYSTKEHKIAVFHIVSNRVKLPMEKVVEICEKYDIPHVPILNTNYILPDTLEELQNYVEGENSKIDGLPKEGIVFYDKKTGQQYFKFVSPEFLIKYHN